MLVTVDAVGHDEVELDWRVLVLVRLEDELERLVVVLDELVDDVVEDVDEERLDVELVVVGAGPLGG